MMRARAINTALLAITGLCQAGLLNAQIVTDGTTGAAGHLAGPDFVIPNTLGTQIGPNLFHSFGDFNINSGESATFTSNFSGPTHNVISRVTGTNPSSIDGRLSSTISGAELWLMNPNGVMFGPSASLDLTGSFHATSADYLAMPDGGRFGADISDPANSLLTLASPAAFGFLDASIGRLTTQSVSLKPSLSPDAALSLVGGDLDLQDSFLGTDGGFILIASAAGPGVIVVPGATPPGDPVVDFGAINLDSATIDSTGLISGDIFIMGDELVLINQAYIFAQSLGDVAGETGGGITVDVDTLLMSGGSQMSSSAGSLNFSTPASVSAGPVTVNAPGGIRIEGQDERGFPTGILAGSRFPSIGKGGAILVNTSTLELIDSGEISSSTFGLPGSDAGSITINASESVFASGQPAPVSTGIFSNTFGSGEAGSITVNTPELKLVHGGSIESGSQLNFCCDPPFPAPGDGGSITVNATRLLIDGGFIEANTEADGAGGDIIVNSDFVELANREAFVYFEQLGPAGSIGVNSFSASGMPAGEIILTAKELRMAPGGTIDAVTFGAGDAGRITVDVNGPITLSGRDQAGLRTGIFATTLNFQGAEQAGDAGAIDIRAGVMQLGAYTAIEAASATNGDAGDVTIQAESLGLLDGGVIDSISVGDGDAGSVTIDVDSQVLVSGSNPLARSQIATSAMGNGMGGRVSITTLNLFVENRGTISATTAGQGAGGTVTLRVDELTLNSGGQITASTIGAGTAGDIIIEGTASPGVAIVADDGFISSSSESSGAAGSISLDMLNILLHNGTEISVQSFADGEAGSITLGADSVELFDSVIEARAVNSAGGDVFMTVQGLLNMINGVVQASAQGLSGGDSGGNVTITGADFITLNRSAVRADANAGAGGNIFMSTGTIVQSADSFVTATSQSSVDGQVTIDSINDVTGRVVDVEVPDMELPDPLSQRCTPSRIENRSTLTVDRVPAGAVQSEYLSDETSPSGGGRLIVRAPCPDAASPPATTEGAPGEPSLGIPRLSQNNIQEESRVWVAN